MVEKVKGVDDWLFVFIVFLVIVFPLLLLASSAVNGLPFLDRDFYTSYLIDFFDLGITLWGVFVGVSLWKTKSKAVIRAKEFLVAILALNIFLLINYQFGTSLLIKFTGWQFSESVSIFLFVSTLIFPYIFGGIIFSIAGLLYLTKSVRVKNTYKFREISWKKIIIISAGVVGLTFILVDILIPIYSPFSP